MAGHRHVWVPAGAATLLSVALVVVLGLPWMSASAALWLSNGSQLLAAVGAALASLGAAHRSRDGQRCAWSLISAGTGSWAAGQLVWSYYEIALGQEVPFPSLADVGFVAFPLVTAVGLSFWLGAQSGLAARGRDLLDGAIIAASLLALSWATTLGSVMAEGGQAWLPVALSLAYPIGDVVLATLVLLAVARGGAAERPALVLVACGLGGLALADSVYVYLVTIGTYSSGDVISAGWASGFLLVAAGALTVGRPDGRDASLGERPGSVAVSPVLRMLLPYVTVIAAAATLCVSMVRDPATLNADLSLGVALVILVLARQFLALTENQRLLAQLAAARDQLQHQALHDPLTGLANRTLFVDRLEHALAQRDVDVAVLYCDLDDFKRVNDEYGHEVGDALLCAAAERLLGCVRPGDTVARLGGDEFAVILEHMGTEAFAVAERVVTSTHRPYLLDGTRVDSSASVGMSRYLTNAAEEPPAAAQQLLKHADTAMYAAKSAGKGRLRMAGVRDPLGAA